MEREKEREEKIENEVGSRRETEETEGWRGRRIEKSGVRDKRETEGWRERRIEK